MRGYDCPTKQCGRPDEGREPLGVGGRRYGTEAGDDCLGHRLVNGIGCGRDFEERLTGASSAVALQVPEIWCME